MIVRRRQWRASGVHRDIWRTNSNRKCTLGDTAVKERSTCAVKSGTAVAFN